MEKNVLLVESDIPLAHELSRALEDRGFTVRTTADGKEGFELARSTRPDCIVLAVELPGLSGYSWCNRLKKDDELRAIPLVITSSEATPETFEQHRKLKTRAEDYLHKPFTPAALADHVVELVGLPDAGHDAIEVEVLDDDLKVLDDAFDSIMRTDEAAAAGVPADEPPLTLRPEPGSPLATSPLDLEMEAALASLAEEAAVAGPSGARQAPVEEDGPRIVVEEDELLPVLDAPPPRSPAVRDEADALREETGALRGETDALRGEADALRGETDALRAELVGLRDTVARLQDDLEAARAALEEARAGHDAARADLDAVRADLDAARADLDAARAEAEGRASTLSRRTQEAEDRAARALQRVRSDEKLREKTRKALALVLQILDEPRPAGEPGSAPPAAPER